VGIVRTGQVLVSVGTSGVVLAPVEAGRPTRDERLHHFAHALPDLDYRMGVMLAAAGALSWFRHGFAADLQGPDWDARLNAEAATVPAGSAPPSLPFARCSLLTLSVTSVPVAKLAVAVLPTETSTPAGLDDTVSPDRPVAVTVIGPVAVVPPPPTFVTPGSDSIRSSS